MASIVFRLVNPRSSSPQRPARGGTISGQSRRTALLHARNRNCPGRARAPHRDEALLLERGEIDLEAAGRFTSPAASSPAQFWEGPASTSGTKPLGAAGLSHRLTGMWQCGLRLKGNARDFQATPCPHGEGHCRSTRVGRRGLRFSVILLWGVGLAKPAENHSG